MQKEKKYAPPPPQNKPLPTIESIFGYLSKLVFIEVDFALSVSGAWDTEGFANKYKN